MTVPEGQQESSDAAGLTPAARMDPSTPATPELDPLVSEPVAFDPAVTDSTEDAPAEQAPAAHPAKATTAEPGPAAQVDPVDDLERACAEMGRLIMGVAADGWESATPCPDWTVRQLVDHVVLGQWINVAVLTDGERPDPDGDHLGDSPFSAYRDASDSLLATLRRPGVLAGTYTVPAGTVPGPVVVQLRLAEQLVHGWDLARATGQESRMAGQTAERSLSAARRMLADVRPGSPAFRAPQPVSDQAPALDQLAALLGRPVG